MDCRKSKPVMESVFFEIRKRKNNKRGQERRAGINCPIIDSIPDLIGNVSGMPGRAETRKCSQSFLLAVSLTLCPHFDIPR